MRTARSTCRSSHKKFGRRKRHPGCRLESDPSNEPQNNIPCFAKRRGREHVLQEETAYRDGQLSQSCGWSTCSHGCSANRTNQKLMNGTGFRVGTVIQQDHSRSMSKDQPQQDTQWTQSPKRFKNMRCNRGHQRRRARSPHICIFTSVGWLLGLLGPCRANLSRKYVPPCHHKYLMWWGFALMSGGGWLRSAMAT